MVSFLNKVEDESVGGFFPEKETFSNGIIIFLCPFDHTAKGPG